MMINIDAFVMRREMDGGARSTALNAQVPSISTLFTLLTGLEIIIGHIFLAIVSPLPEVLDILQGFVM